MPSKEKGKSRWSKMKDSLAKSYQNAKQKYKDFKADIDGKSQNSTDFQYGQNELAKIKDFSSHPIFLQKKCPFCSFSIPSELLSHLSEHHQIVCEHCGSLIDLTSS